MYPKSHTFSDQRQEISWDFLKGNKQLRGNLLATYVSSNHLKRQVSYFFWQHLPLKPATLALKIGKTWRLPGMSNCMTSRASPGPVTEAPSSQGWSWNLLDGFSMETTRRPFSLICPALILFELSGKNSHVSMWAELLELGAFVFHSLLRFETWQLNSVVNFATCKTVQTMLTTES